MFGFFRKKEQAKGAQAPVRQDNREGNIADLQARMEQLENERDALGAGIDTLNAERKALMARLQAATAASDKNALARRILLADKQIKAKDNLRRTYDEKISRIIDVISALGDINATHKGGTEDIISSDELLNEIQKAAEEAQTAAIKDDIVRDAASGLSSSGHSSEMDAGLEEIFAEAAGAGQAAPTASAPTASASTAPAPTQSEETGRPPQPFSAGA